MSPKFIRDTVHGDIPISDRAAKILKMPLFQRLRGIKQTGLLYLIYPGMQHSRFEHSLGAYFLASQNFDHFLNIDWNLVSGISETVANNMQLKVELTKRTMEELKKKEVYWRNIFEIAALIHDIGHGPYSHTFEDLGLLIKENFITKSIEQQLPHLEGTIVLYLKHIAKLKHEDISLIYLEDVAKQLDLSKEETQFIALMIHSKYRESLLKDYLPTSNLDNKKAIATLLSIFISGPFDVDRMDYMERDSLSAGVNYGKVESSRLFRSLIPVLTESHGFYNVGIVSQLKTLHMIDHFFVNLNSLYKILYYHPAALRIAYEYTQALELDKADLLKKIHLQSHRTLDDARLHLELLDSDVKNFVDDIIARQVRDADTNSKIAFEMSENASPQLKQVITGDRYKYRPIPIPDREIVKDVNVIYIAEKFKTANQGEFRNWKDYSFVAKATNFSSHIMWRNELFTERLGEIKQILAQKVS